MSCEKMKQVSEDRECTLAALTPFLAIHEWFSLKLSSVRHPGL